MRELEKAQGAAWIRAAAMAVAAAVGSPACGKEAVPPVTAPEAATPAGVDSGPSSAVDGAPASSGTDAASPACSTACNVDADCACGTNRVTGACAVGRAECIDTLKRCPDFCTGIAGNIRIACVGGTCTQSRVKR